MEECACVAEDRARHRDRLRSELQQLRGALRGVLGSLTALAATKDAARKDAVAAADQAVERLAPGRRCEDLQRILGEAPYLGAGHGDAITTLVGHVMEVERRWKASDRSDAAATHVLAEVEAALVLATRLSLPGRVNEVLANVPPGRSLDFHAWFRDEVPDEARRRELLDQLKTQEAYVGGIVDPSAGLIYRRSPSRAFRIFTYLSPALFVALGVLVLYLVSLFDWGAKSRVDDLAPLLKTYWLVLAGAAAHLLIENVKQLQSGNVQVLAIGDFANWMHLRWLGIGATLWPILVCVLGLRVTTSLGTSGSDALTLLFAGYSIDSLAGLILTRFQTSAGKGAGALKKVLGAK